ncbi:MAG: aldose epimerase [Actinomycetota bacterium]
MNNESCILVGKNTSCTVDPTNGGRLASLIAFGRELLIVKNSETNPQRWGSYPMVPYAGRVREGRFSFDGIDHNLELSMPPHAIHGTVLDRPFEVLDANSTSVSMQIDLGDRFAFEGLVTQTISLVDDVLNCSLTVQTRSPRMPVQVGWHPWFARPCRLEAEFSEMYVRDAAGIPTGRTIAPPPPPYDDCFRGSRRSPRIIFDESIHVTVESDCSHWVVYDQPEHAICVEPQSGPPDGFNLEPFFITPDSPISRFMRLTVSK